MAVAAVNSKYDALHEDLPFHDGTFAAWGKESSEMPYSYRAGVTLWVSSQDLTPGDEFLNR